MALPVVLGLASLGVSVFSNLMGGAAAKRAGELAQRAAESEALLNEFNANVADAQAKDAIAIGAEEESRFRAGVRGLIGSQRAGIAAGNVDVGFGSALDVQADAAYMGELDSLTIRNNAARAAWGYEVEAGDYRRRAAINRQGGQAAAASGRQQKTQYQLGAVNSVLGAAPGLLQNVRGMRVPKAPNASRFHEAY
jgi:hypothetical protein